MEQWRERGYVPDSDDEDDELGSQHTELHLETPIEHDETNVNPEEQSQQATDRNKDEKIEAGQPEKEEEVGDKENGDHEGSVTRDDQIEHAPNERLDEGVGRGNQEGGAIDINENKEHQVVVEIPVLHAQYTPTTPVNDTNDFDDLEGDPLQNDDGPTTRRINNGPLNLHTKEPATTAISPLPNREEPPSSPDEIQFQEHFQPLEPVAPVTPVRRLLKSPSARSDVGNESSSSSSLSSVPSNIIEPPFYFHPATRLSPRRGQASRDHSNVLEETPEVTPLVITDEPPTTPHRRALRPRNAAQLNPFLIDIARYEKACREAGIRPEKFQGFSRPAQQPTKESQEEEFQDENVSPPSSPSQSFRFPPPSPSLPRAMANNRQHNGRGVDARPPPDRNPRDTSKPEARRPGAKATYSGLKRRKLSHAGDQAQAGSSRTPKRSSVQVIVDNSSRVGRLMDDPSIFDVPVSPPPSGSPAATPIDQENPTFRFPRGFSPVPVPTPVTERRPSRRAGSFEDAIHIDSSLPSGREYGSVIQDEPEANSVSESPEDETVAIGRIRRRIKGVLPASWLRLDQEKQEQREILQTEKERTKRRLNDRQSAKGVAQRISRKPITGTPRTTFVIPDNSSSESDKAPAGSVHGSVSRPVTINEFLGIEEDDDIDDIPEDNRIDHMYPAVPRQRAKSSNQASSRPKRPSNASSRRVANPRPRAPRQTRITDSIDRRTTPKKPKPRVPKLGILDAPDIRNQSNKNQPQFLRVAARKARSRRDQGRASPTQKFLRLGTRADTEDANSALRQWREGTIRPARDPARTNRPKQAPRSRARQGLNREGNIVPVGDAEREEARSVRSIVSKPDAQSNREFRPPAADKSVNDDQGSSTGVQRKNRTNNKQKRWVVRKGYVVSSFKRNAPRPVDLDDIALPDSRPKPTSFQQSLSALNAAYRSAKPSSGNYSLPLGRFLSGAQTARPSPKPVAPEASDSHQQTRQHAIQRAPRKRPPQHVNAEAMEYRQPILSLPETGPASVISFEELDTPSLRGLHSLPLNYSVDFDTSPLQIGTYFHESTFIGSGTFSRSLKVSTRDMDVSCGYTAVFCNGETYRWGSWNEVVSTEVEALFDSIIDIASSLDLPGPTETADTTSRPLEVYRSFICYVNDTLSFLDPVDRRMFVDKCLKLLSRMSDIDPSYASADQPGSARAVECRVRLQTLSLVLANQVRQVASHDLVERAKRNDIVDVILAFATRISRAIVSDAGIKNVRNFLEENKLRDKREAGIKEQYPIVEAYLVAHEITYNQLAKHGQRLDDPLSKALMGPQADLELQTDARRLEKIWFVLFSTLPLRELDDLGILQPGSRFERCHDQWPIIKQLVSKVSEIYGESPRTQPASLNKYMRSLFHRCFHLIQRWGWRHCKPILETLFDFFARNELHNLDNEETHGSPTFLNELGKESSIESDSRDSCFHTLLKMIAVGLRFMSNTHDKKYIRNLAWRLLPNHGRNYPKAEPLRQQDLDALRNHHDLLCTLYSSTPAGCRPRLETIRNLVHPANSHGEACSINIHAWLRLVKFKLSTDEDSSDLAEFSHWHSHFVVEILKQHSLARTEVEAQDTSDSSFSRHFVESTISANQRRIESLVSSALVCMKSGIDATRNVEQAQILIEGFPIEKLLGLFNPKSKRIAPVICQTLDVINSYAAASSRPCAPEPRAAEPQIPLDPNEDSQEYGDWNGFAELCDVDELGDVEMQDVQPAVQHIDVVFRPTLSQFVSRCFGEEQAPDDSVLLKIIDTWTSVARVLVMNKLRQWDSYLNPYDADSWTSLRSTDQTRRFMPHFLAKMLEKGHSAYSECRFQLLNCWLVSLVERGSMLKYQHQLTNALLNEGRTDPVLRNLPFSGNKLSGRFDISLDEICQRRVSLMSCVLSNMREHLFEVEQQGAETRTRIAVQYKEMLQALMAAMKDNYKELGGGHEHTHGSYVEFVHQIVEFLQQHSQGICPLDTFFTDPASFPLPASDPTYIVAKLKSYAVRLLTGKTTIQLVTFIQQVSERAAMDNQQNYLVDQLYNAMSHTFESGDYERPTLRSILLQCVFPVYVQSAFTNHVAWLLVRPLLQSTTRMFSDLVLDIDSTNVENVCHIVELVRTYFEAVDHSLQLLVDHPGLLEEPTILLTLTSFVETIVAPLAVIDYLYRVSDEAAVLVAYVDRFRQFTLFAISSLLDPATAVAPDSFETLQHEYACDDGHHQRPSPPAYFTEARDYAARELQTRLRNGWSVYEGRYFVQQGQQSKEILVDPACKSVEVARGSFVRSVEVLFGNLEALDAFEF